MRAIKVYLQKFSKINIICYLKAASGDKVRSEMSGASAVTGDPILLAMLAASG